MMVCPLASDTTRIKGYRSHAFRTSSGSLTIRRDRPLTEKPEDPLSNVDPPASMSRNDVRSPWGKCEADTIRGHLATAGSD